MTFPDTPEAQIAELSHLRRARQSAYEYYAPFLESDDEVLYVGSWCAVLALGIPADKFDAAVDASRYASVQRAAFAYFEKIMNHDRAQRVLATKPIDEGNPDIDAMRARLDVDAAAQVQAETRAFLATGRLSTPISRGGPVQELGTIAEKAGGWRARLPWVIRATLLTPHGPGTVQVLLSLLYDSSQDRLIDEVVAVLTAADLHPYLAAIFSAASAHLKGDLVSARQKIEASATARQSREDVMRSGRIFSLRLLGTVLEGLGDYRGAYAAFKEFNALSRDTQIDMSRFAKATTARGSLTIPRLPPDERTSDFMMLGFPRSGTTLLENALAAHPDIETFEELPTLNATNLWLEQATPPGGLPSVRDYIVAREKYYEEIDRYRHKKDARVLVDKMPMRSAEAQFLVKMFPEKRYLFSVRHPFDVALSCFRQNFEANVAMVHFYTIAEASRLYDFTMSQWFSVFTLDDPRVQYVRYDELVEAFEPTLGSALEFLGAGWNDAVHDFAKAADERRSKTPSYQKVRQGLSIGVQTYWRNYKFVFDSPDAKPLHKWAEFFGYPTS